MGKVHGWTIDRLTRHPVWDGKIICGQRRQVIDIINKRCDGCLIEGWFAIKQVAVYLEWDKMCIFEVRGTSLEFQWKGSTRNEENTRSRQFFRRPSHHESECWWSSGKKGNLECRLENSRGTFHCLNSRSANGRAPGGWKKNDAKAKSIPKVDLRYASSKEKSNNITKVLIPLCWGLGIQDHWLD